MQVDRYGFGRAPAGVSSRVAAGGTDQRPASAAGQNRFGPATDVRLSPEAQRAMAGDGGKPARAGERSFDLSASIVIDPAFLEAEIAAVGKEMRARLADAGIDSHASFDISHGGPGGYRVHGHPDAARIEALLAEDPQLARRMQYCMSTQTLMESGVISSDCHKRLSNGASPESTVASTMQKMDALHRASGRARFANGEFVPAVRGMGAALVGAADGTRVAETARTELRDTALGLVSRTAAGTARTAGRPDA